MLIGVATYERSGSSALGYTYVYTLTVTVPSFIGGLDYFVDTPIGSAVLHMTNGSIVYSTEAELYPKSSNSKIASSSFNSSTNKLTLVSTSISSNPWNNNTHMPVVFTKFYDD